MSHKAFARMKPWRLRRPGTPSAFCTFKSPLPLHVHAGVHSGGRDGLQTRRYDTEDVAQTARRIAGAGALIDDRTVIARILRHLGLWQQSVRVGKRFLSINQIGQAGVFISVQPRDVPNGDIGLPSGFEDDLLEIAVEPP